MKTVNPYFLNELLSPITGLTDDDEAVILYQNMNLNDEAQYRKIIKDLFKPHFNGISEIVQQKSKLALSYYLSKDNYDFEGVFESCLPPFDPPKNPRDFFVWLWEELFGNEDYKISDVESFKEVPDVHEPNRPVKNYK